MTGMGGRSEGLRANPSEAWMSSPTCKHTGSSLHREGCDYDQDPLAISYVCDNTMWTACVVRVGQELVYAHRGMSV